MVIGHILKDHNVHTGALGTFLVMASKWIAENISPLLGLMAALGGLIVVILSIKEKVKKNRILDAELKIKEHELKKLNS